MSRLTSVEPTFLRALTLTPATPYLATAAVFSSTLFFGNIIFEIAGPVSLMRSPEGRKQINGAQKAMMFAWMFKPMAAEVIVSSLATAISAFLASRQTLYAGTKTYAYVAITAALALHPWTLGPMMSTNKRLFALDKKRNSPSGAKANVTGGTGAPAAKLGGEGLSEAEEKEVDGVLDTWVSLHRVRGVLFTIAWASSMAALMLELSTGGR